MEILIAICALIAAVVAAFFVGRKTKNSDVQAESLNNVKQAKDVSDNISIMDADIKRNRLRDSIK